MNKAHLKAIPAAWQRTARMFTALGDPQRQRILLLFEKGEQLNVGQIAEVSTLSRPAVSHHLKVLRQAGVLVNEKVGKEVYYRVDKKAIKDALGAVLDYLKAL
jgi:DNA-binding transcriptional ArsR family regulator